MELKKIPHCLMVVFLLGGIYFLIKDISLFAIWLLFIPTAWLFWKAVERQRIILAIIMLFFWITLGIDPVLFYMRRTRWTMTGWNAVGTFSFSAADFVSAYMPVLLLALSIYVFFNLLMREKSNLISDYLKVFRRRQKTWYKQKQSRVCGMILCVLLIAVFIPLNIIMFENSIGITGMVSPSLPFHLVGILRYFRMLVIPMIIFVLYVNSNNTNFQFACVLVYTFVAAFASASRSLFMINMIICVVVNVLNNNWKKTVMAMVYIIVLFSLIGVSRNYIYVYNYTDYVDLVQKVMRNFSFSQIEDTIITTVSGISNRLFGMQYYVLAEQNGAEGGVVALLQYLSAGTYTVIEPDMSTNIFGLELMEGYAFGVAMGVVSELIMIANGNYAMIVLEGFLMALVFVYLEKVLVYIHAKNQLLSIFLCLIFAYVLLQFWMANINLLYMCVGVSIALVMAVSILPKLNLFANRKAKVKEGLDT